MITFQGGSEQFFACVFVREPMFVFLCLCFVFFGVLLVVSTLG